MINFEKSRRSVGAGDAVVDSTVNVPIVEAPATREGVYSPSLPPYRTKHLTCELCSGKLIHINGILVCEDCEYCEGCCE